MSQFHFHIKAAAIWFVGPSKSECFDNDLEGTET